MGKITFSPKRQLGIEMYFSKDTSKISVLKNSEDNRYYIRIWNNDSWHYPAWCGIDEGFRTLKDAQEWLSMHDWENATVYHIEEDDDAYQAYDEEFAEALKMLGFQKSTDNFYTDGPPVYDMYMTTDSGTDIHIQVLAFSDENHINYYVNNKKLPQSSVPKPTRNIARTIRNIETVIRKYGGEIFASSEVITATSQAIMAAINTRNLAQDLVKVRSSNVWAYCMNIKNRKDKFGDVLVQFKEAEGGPGDIYIYYDVPVMVWRRWQSALSKGHYFWVYIRDNYKYSKLTGDKRGKLPNAVN